MPVNIYPQPQTHPLNIASGVTAPGFTIDPSKPTPTSTNWTMVIRVAVYSPSFTVPDPTFQLQAGSGPPVIAGSSSTNIFSDAAESEFVGFIEPLGHDGNNVFVLRVDVSADATWKLTITNNDTIPRDFVIVSSDTDDGSKQPWIEADASLVLDVLVSEGGPTAPGSLIVRNKGTGPLTFTSINVTGANAALFTPESTFTLVSVLPSTDPPLRVALTPQAAIGQLAATMTFVTNDTTSTSAPGHNGGPINISCTVRKLEVAFLLDTSGSMSFGPLGDSQPDNSTRWSFLQSGAAAALGVIKNFGDGKGTFAIGMYPDISLYPATTGAPYAGPFPVPSPSAADIIGGSGAMVPIASANVTTATTNLGAHFPRQNGGATPIGRGIEQGIGAVQASYGYFNSSHDSVLYNRRWVVLMSDGNHNSDPPTPQAFYPPTATPPGTLPSFQTKAVKVLTMAYGSDAATNMLTNKQLLRDIATNAGGTVAANFLDADLTNYTTNSVQTFIKATILAGLSLDTLTDPVGVLTGANPVVKRQVPVTALDNKLSFVVSWATHDAKRLRVQVQTPLGELLEGPSPGVTVDYNARFRMITVSRDFLENREDPANPRTGTWTLILSLAEDQTPAITPAATERAEQYDYQVLLDSRLKLRLELDQASYAAGDPVKIAARLTVDGVGVPNAAVMLTRVVPGAALHNFLAKSPLSQAEYERAAGQQANNPDVDSIALKATGLAAKGIRYNPSAGTDAIPLVDAAGIGTYSGATTNTSVPGTYRFTVTAVGALPDGTSFRREQGVDVLVTVRPEIEWSPIDIRYGQITEHEVTFSTATITVHPGDRFGNVIFIDPSIDPTIGFTASVGQFPEPIVDNHDGSYSRTLVYPVGSTPTIGVTVGGVTLAPGTPLAPVGELRFVDTVYGFAPGREAVHGANQHAHPRACLGDPTARPTPTFVSLGGGGSLVVGIGRHYILPSRSGHDITVFVQPDQELRPYAVEVMRGDDFNHGRWERLGRSPGVTQSFSLRAAHLPAASAIRIVDLSHRVKNTDGTPSHTPGVSILGVGARHVERGDGDLDDLVIAWLKRVGHALFGG